MTEVKDFWRGAVLDMADRGAVTQRQVHTVTRPGKVFHGSGYDFARALQEACANGFFEPAPFHAGFTGKRVAAVMTDAGRAQLEEYRRQRHEGLLSSDRPEPADLDGLCGCDDQ